MANVIDANEEKSIQTPHKTIILIMKRVIQVQKEEENHRKTQMKIIIIMLSAKRLSMEMLRERRIIRFMKMMM